MPFKTQESCNPFEDNIKMDLQEMGWEDMYWIDLAQNSDRWWTLINAVMNLRVP
jgi:hypothetical protein